MEYTQADAERFWKYVDRRGDGECWEWLGSLVKGMYGQFRLGKTNVATHRFSYMLANGRIRKGKVIRHMCNNTKCCNPAHLRDGWHEDNTADIVRSATRKRELGVGEADMIRKMHSEGKTRREIAEALHCGFYVVAGMMDREGLRAGHCGRPKGSKNRRPRITAEIKAAICAEYAAGSTQKFLAEKYGCHQTYVSILARGETQ
jgi:hypothetical protein